MKITLKIKKRKAKAKRRWVLGSVKRSIAINMLTRRATPEEVCEVCNITRATFDAFMTPYTQRKVELQQIGYEALKRFNVAVKAREAANG